MAPNMHDPGFREDRLYGPHHLKIPRVFVDDKPLVTGQLLQLSDQQVGDLGKLFRAQIHQSGGKRFACDDAGASDDTVAHQGRFAGPVHLVVSGQNLFDQRGS